MDVKTLINPSVKAIRVIDLQKGTVYKRVKKEYSDTYKVVYGVVTDILHGESTYIEVAEIGKEYSSPKFEYQVLGEKSDLNMYPTTKEEMKDYFDSIDVAFQKDIEHKRQEADELESKYHLYKSITSDNFIKIQNTETTLIEG